MGELAQAVGPGIETRVLEYVVYPGTRVQVKAYGAKGIDVHS